MRPTGELESPREITVERRTKALCLVLAAVVVAGQALSAQWLKYPTRGVPRTPAGAPDLGAPTPRAADGKPDFSGIWEPVKNRPCPPNGCFDMEVSEEFFNIGWSLKNGLPYQPWAAQAVKERTEQNGKDDPVTHCQPPSLLQLHTTPQLRKILRLPDLLVILSEFAVGYRQIFTDGRPLPVDPNPSFVGYSSATWDGDTLVVQTNGFKDGLWLDRNGSPLTDAAKVTERFRRVNYGRLEIDVTVDDPQAYTAPWTVTLGYNIVLDTDLLEYHCSENERDAPHLVGK
jgi:hypothetical protein